jgi:small-conductance mechanosensitive channel
MDEFRQLALDALALPWVRALLVVVVAIVGAKIVDFFLCRTLLRLARRTRTDLDERLIQHLHRPVFVSVVLVGLHMATRILQLGEPFQGLVLGIIVSLAVLIWAGAAFRILRVLLEIVSTGAEKGGWIDSRTLPLLDNLMKIAVAGVAFYALLLTWDLDVKPALASAGIVGIALGFAAKDTLANLFGGIFVIADSPYKIGDYIVLDTGERGVVTQIGLRSTRLLTRDDVEITVPNAQIANAKIVNESGGPWEKHRVTVRIGVAYGSDVDHVRRALLEAAGSVDHLSSEPEPRVRFTEFGDSALVFRLLCWIDRPADRGLVLDSLNTAVYKKLKAEGIQIPFPQRDVHLKGGCPAA